MIKERIMQFLSKEGLSPSQFAEKIGIQRSSISHILSGRNKPSFDFFRKLIDKYPNINLEWFFNGEGTTYKDKVDNNTLLTAQVVDNKKEQNDSVDKSEQTLINTSVNTADKVVLLFTDGTFEVFAQKNRNQ